MGRAIEMENRQDKSDSRQNDFDRRLKLVEDALEELLETKVHHVNLDSLDEHEREMRKENGVALEADEEFEEVFTPPAGKRKKTRKKDKTATTT